MQQLLPTYAPTVEVVQAYRYPDERPDQPWVRANMVCSVDGSAVQGGRSQGLSTPADQALFQALRSLADVVLVGAGTVRTEGYRALRPKAEHQELRARLGLGPAPVLAVVSRRLDLDPASALFTGPEPTVVVTAASSDPQRRDWLEHVADIMVAGDDHVDLRAALRALADRGLTRVLCEGGPSLLGDLTAAGLLDELCLTVSPKAVGGEGRRITDGPPTDLALTLASVLEHEGTLFCRYVHAERDRRPGLQA